MLKSSLSADLILEATELNTPSSMYEFLCLIIIVMKERTWIDIFCRQILIVTPRMGIGTCLYHLLLQASLRWKGFTSDFSVESWYSILKKKNWKMGFDVDW